jgi:drug/metabolite transporter superfamily protein YnfA
MRDLAILALAALLEIGGDALVRWGIEGGRVLGFVLGAALLLLYGLVVNAPSWTFGWLLGIYIAVFFVMSQVVAYAVYKEEVDTPTVVGGAFIVIGGAILAFWRGK